MTADAATPVLTLSPGWYWAYVSQSRDGTAALTAFQKKNKGKVFTTKTVSPGLSTVWDYYFKRDNESQLQPVWILFEVRSPVEWTLAGRPSRASKGAETNITDIAGDEEVVPAITSPEHPWNQFWNGTGEESPVNPIMTAWNALGNAGPIVIYGGAAILLWKLFHLLPEGSSRSTRSERAPRQLPAGRR